MRLKTLLIILTAATPGMLGAAEATSPTLALRPSATPATQVPLLKVEIVRTLPHDTKAFTQGLLLHGGRFLESTGLYRQSTLRRVDPATGVVEQQVDLPAEYFAEGLALAGGQLVQITWRERKAFVYDVETLGQVGEFDYEGEGWGLTFDGRHFIMSDGSERLAFREPGSFQTVRTVTVRFDGRPVPKLNELEFAEGFVYANIWGQDAIVKIDPKDGRVAAAINAMDLLTPEERRSTDVLNGIAFDPATKHFFLTGKLWPKVFEVRFVPSG